MPCAVPCSLTLTAHKLCSANKGERIVQMPNDCFIFFVCPARRARVFVRFTSLTFGQKRRKTTKVKLPVCRTHLSTRKKHVAMIAISVTKGEKCSLLFSSSDVDPAVVVGKLLDQGKLNRSARHGGENIRILQVKALFAREE